MRESLQFGRLHLEDSRADRCFGSPHELHLPDNQAHNIRDCLLLLGLYCESPNRGTGAASCCCKNRCFDEDDNEDSRPHLIPDGLLPLPAPGHKKKWEEREKG